MKLVSTAKDSLAVDPRSKGVKPATDSSSNDNGSAPFGGVLAELGADAKSTALADGTSKKPTAATTADATTVDASGSDVISALINAFSKGTGTATTPAAASSTDPKSDAKAASDSDTDGDDLVDSLLKRMASKETAAIGSQTATPTPATTPTADMMSILMLGAVKAAPAAPSDSRSTGSGSSASDAVKGALDGQAASSATEAPASTEGKEMIVSDVSVATHLAPAVTTPSQATVPGRTATATAQPADTAFQSAVSSAAGATHGRSDDSTALQKTNADPSAAVTTALPLGEAFAPVRSIATAIGELAAQAAPSAAATVPADPTKTVLGVARTLTLQMNPADMGTVDIRLHMTGETLDVQLTISNAETLGIVSRERDSLATALNEQSYKLNSLVIQDGGASASSGGNNAATQGDTSGSNARTGGQSGSAGSDPQGSGRQGQGAGQRPGGDPAPRPVVADARSGSLFV